MLYIINPVLPFAKGKSRHVLNLGFQIFKDSCKQVPVPLDSRVRVPHGPQLDPVQDQVELVSSEVAHDLALLHVIHELGPPLQGLGRPFLDRVLQGPYGSLDLPSTANNPLGRVAQHPDSDPVQRGSELLSAAGVEQVAVFDLNDDFVPFAQDKLGLLLDLPDDRLDCAFDLVAVAKDHLESPLDGPQRHPGQRGFEPLGLDRVHEFRGLDVFHVGLPLGEGEVRALLDPPDYLLDRSFDHVARADDPLVSVPQRPLDDGAQGELDPVRPDAVHEGALLALGHVGLPHRVRDLGPPLDVPEQGPDRALDLVAPADDPLEGVPQHAGRDPVEAGLELLAFDRVQQLPALALDHEDLPQPERLFALLLDLPDHRLDRAQDLVPGALDPLARVPQGPFDQVAQSDLQLLTAQAVEQRALLALVNVGLPHGVGYFGPVLDVAHQGAHGPLDLVAPADEPLHSVFHCPGRDLQQAGLKLLALDRVHEFAVLAVDDEELPESEAFFGLLLDLPDDVLEGAQDFIPGAFDPLIGVPEGPFDDAAEGDFELLRPDAVHERSFFALADVDLPHRVGDLGPLFYVSDQRPDSPLDLVPASDDPLVRVPHGPRRDLEQAGFELFALDRVHQPAVPAVQGEEVPESD